MLFKLAIVYLALLHWADAWYYGRPAPGLATVGEVWPLPQKHDINLNLNHTLDPAAFTFSLGPNSDCDILQKAFIRYKKWTFPEFKQAGNQKADVAPTLIGIKVTVSTDPKNVSYPQADMNEEYTLEIKEGTSVTAELTAKEVWGALRGLETFSQLVYYNIDANTYHAHVASINDKPRFLHRGLMIDSTRHFLSINVIKRNLDLMAQNKMNVMHWHMVDSEAFTFTSTKFPDLSAKGAYTPRHIHSQHDMQDVIDYARNRGIRVIAEFDTPGHMGAWGKGQPGLLNECFDDNGNFAWPNIIDPSKPGNFAFLQTFFTEAQNFFHDKQMHFGGDETTTARKQCWLNNKNFAKWMKDNNYADDKAVLNAFFQNLTAIVKQAKADTQMIVWQDLLSDGVKVPKDTIIHVWMGGPYDQMLQQMQEVTKKGYQAIMTSCWYLNYIKYGNDWGYVDDPNKRRRGMYYECDPTGFQGSDAQKALVIGGEAMMWAEFVDGTNIIERTWPRASAVAERLWSNASDTKSADAAWPRLHEHRCRMMRRGYDVQPLNNPGYCPAFWDPQFPDIMD